MGVFFVAFPWLAVAEEQVVPVWVNAGAMQAHNWNTIQQPWLREESARRKAQWLSGGHRKVSYTLVQDYYSPLQIDDCSKAPISIEIRDGIVVRAKYAATATPACFKGADVDPKVYPFDVLTPSDLFKVVQLAAYGDASQDNICLDVRFDEATGLPTKLYRSCPWIVDDGRFHEFSCCNAGPSRSALSVGDHM